MAVKLKLVAALVVAAVVGSIAPVLAAPISIDRTAAEALPMAPKPQWKVTPYYPSGAAEAKLSGRVVLVIRIKHDGSVGDIGLFSEEPGGYGFGQFAADAVQQWVYEQGKAGMYRQAVNFTYNLK